MTASTIILLVAVLACAALAVRRLARRGMGDCGSHCERGRCKGCKGCKAAKEMAHKLH